MLIADRSHPGGGRPNVPYVSCQKWCAASRSSNAPYTRGTMPDPSTPPSPAFGHEPVHLVVCCARARTTLLRLATPAAAPGSRTSDHNHSSQHSGEKEHAPVCPATTNCRDDCGAARRPCPSFTPYNHVSDSVSRSAAAAGFVPSLGLRGKCDLPISASTTAAELAAIDLAANQLAHFLPRPVAVSCDSRTTLLPLARGEHGSPIAQRLTRKFAVIAWSGCDVF
ncbi:hypothetical protein MRX96_015984 [Rhipicephalus microplus]